MQPSPLSRTIWIGLPAYNEEATIPALFPRFKQVFPDKTQLYRIVLYDDGCTDRTVERALAWRDELNVEVIGKRTNMGLGEGLRSLLDHAISHGADNDMLFIMDCDDTHHPRQLSTMAECLDRGYEVVIASRYRHGSRSSGVPLHRQVLSLAAAAMFKVLHWCHGVRDYTCGFRGYRLAILKRARDAYGDRLITERGFACMVELLLKLNRIGARTTEIPLELRYDLKQSPSKMDVGGNTLQLLKKLIAWRVRGLK